jgi:hypothetical protein
MIGEFVNPKYRDGSKSAFKSSTRLECMMQDYPKALPAGARVGFTAMNQVRVARVAHACFCTPTHARTHQRMTRVHTHAHTHSRRTRAPAKPTRARHAHHMLTPVRTPGVGDVQPRQKLG